MASKKCPKCGEDNPAEAVMCWACYTPLTGSAPIAAGIGAAGSVRPGAAAAAAKPGQIGAPTQEEGTKKEIDPKMFVVGGLLLLGIGLAVVMNTGILGGSSDEDDSGSTGTDPTGTVRPAPVPQPGPPIASGGPAPSVSMPQGGSAVPAAAALPYNVVVPPNPKYATGTLGILATQQNLSQSQAGGLAKFARDQFARNGKWTGMQIAVFSDPAAAKQFASYQAKRRGAPLNANDYQQLANTNIWMGAPAFYQSVGKKETVFYPSRNPMNWWSKAG